MGILKELVNLIIPVEDMSKPRKEEQMSPKQMYDYLVSTWPRTPEEQAMLERLHVALGKNKWDSP